MSNFRIFILLAAALSTTACERINITREIPVNLAKSKSVFIDAKQRVVTYIPATTVHYIKNKDGSNTTTTQTSMRVCAEPSPDALTAIATSANGGLSAGDKFNFNAAFSRAETAASIGLRTQSIQLMRDVLYRMCEEYQSGALTPAGVETLQRRYQSSMVTILAIEQLTGVVRPPPVILGSETSRGGAAAASDILGQVSSAKKSLSTAQDKVAEAKVNKETTQSALDGLLKDGGEVAPEKMSVERKAKWQELKDANEKALSDLSAASDAQTAREDDLADAKTALAALGAGDSAASATGEFQQGESDRNSVETAQVAAAVQEIVSDTLNLGFLREACATMFVAMIEGRSAVEVTSNDSLSKDNFADICIKYGQTTADMAKASVTRQDAISDLIAKIDPKNTNSAEVLKIVLGMASTATSTTTTSSKLGRSGSELKTEFPFPPK